MNTGYIVWGRGGVVGVDVGVGMGCCGEGAEV